MATPVYFVDGVNGLDTNDGLDNIGVALVTATWTEATLTLTQAGHGYTFAAGDVIYLSAGTGLTVGLYEVASSTANDIVLVGTSSLPTVGNGTDVAAGDDATGDWTSSDGPWVTVDKAMNTISAADQTHVWINVASGYAESPSIDTAVTSQQNTATFEGYTTTLGDDGQITITGTLTDVANTRVHYCFKNIIFDANSANNNAVNITSYEIMFRKCKFINANQNGCSTGFHTFFWDCDFNDNLLDGWAGGALGAFFNCRFYRNGVAGIDGSSTVLAWNCTFYSNNGNACDGGAANESHVICINCTFDGHTQQTNTGVFKNTTIRGMIAMINCIVYDCTEGSNGVHDDRDLYLNNLLNSNTADFSGSASDQEGTHQSGAPDFVNEVGGADYTLNPGSPAIGAGHDAKDEMDIGSHQVAGAGGGGGGLLTHPGTSGGARA